MKKILLLIACFLLLITSYSFAQNSSCDPNLFYQYNLNQLSNCKNDLQKAYDLSVNATKPLESELLDLQKKINGMKARLSAIEQELELKRANIEKGYKELTKQKETLNKNIASYYIKSYYNSPFVIFLSNPSAVKIIQNLAFQRALANQDREKIVNFALLLTDLETQKKDLEREQLQLSSLKSGLDQQSAKLDKIVGGAKAYQASLSGQIAKLSGLQEAILTGKSGTFTTSVGDVPLADDPNASPNYNPGFSPAFAAFSFGAYTHRKGMSQYGAKGRASSPYNQDARTILRAYYGTDPIGKDTGGNINVDGYGTMDFETTYLYGIAEMPSSFPTEALKAQAIAARSYAYSYKASGGSICTSESCQVFSKSKSDNPPGEWKAAVDATRGQVVEGVTAYYSSTTGGYITTMGWDTTSGNKDTWTSGAYEKIAGSPWFYKGWYTQYYYNSSDKCGRSSPWLNQEEMSDILNAYLIQNKGGVDNGRITPVTTSCWGGNPYSAGETRDLANSVGGGAVTSISNVSVVYSTDGTTSSLSFSVNGGSKTVQINGSDFKQIFNLRAPGFVSIRSKLYNIEQK